MHAQTHAPFADTPRCFIIAAYLSLTYRDVFSVRQQSCNNTSSSPHLRTIQQHDRQSHQFEKGSGLGDGEEALVNNADGIIVGE